MKNLQRSATCKYTFAILIFVIYATSRSFLYFICYVFFGMHSFELLTRFFHSYLPILIKFKFCHKQLALTYLDFLLVTVFNIMSFCLYLAGHMVLCYSKLLLWVSFYWMPIKYSYWMPIKYS